MGKFMIFVAGLITGCLLTFVFMGSLMMFQVHVERQAAVRAHEEAEQARLAAAQAAVQALLQSIKARDNDSSWLPAKRALEEARDLAERQLQEAEAQRQPDKE